MCLNPNHSILTLTGWFTVTKLYQHVDKKRKKIQRDTNQSVVPNKPKMYARPSLRSAQTLGLWTPCCSRVGLNTQTGPESCKQLQCFSFV